MYRPVTYDLTISVVRTLAKLNPRMTFIYVSGMGTDSTGQARAMLAVARRGAPVPVLENRDINQV